MGTLHETKTFGCNVASELFNKTGVGFINWHNFVGQKNYIIRHVFYIHRTLYG